MVKAICYGLLMSVLFSSCSQLEPITVSNQFIHPQLAEITLSDNSNQLPPDSQTWSNINLPDNWNISRPDQGGGAWYRIPVNLDRQMTESMGVVLVNFSMNAAIWWDGVQIVSGGSMHEPLTRNWHTPLFASIATTQLQQGSHWLHIYIRGYGNDAAGLGNVFIGPETELRPIYDAAHFQQVTLSAIAYFVTLLMALGALLMWLLQRQEKSFAWIALASLFWSQAISNFFVNNPPLPRFYWEVICQGAVEFYVLALVVLVLRMLTLNRPRLVKGLTATFVGGWSVIIVFGENANVMAWAMPLHTMAALVSLWLCMLCFTHWFRHRHKTALLAGFAMSWQLAFAGHDWWVIYFGNQMESVLIMQFGPTLMLLMMGAWMIHNFSQALQASESHVAEVEAEVARVTVRLRKEQEHMAQMQKKQIVSEERERFTRDLHDGLGGYLASVSAMLHDGVRDEALLTRTIDQALLEMRIVVDGFGDECNDVGMLLGMLRHRLQQPLQAWGLQVSWNITGIPIACTLPDGHAIHLMRIVQEALTNAARHAEADWLEVRASMVNEPDSRKLCIEVVDNGQGWDELPTAGNGFSNMRKRAEILNASLNKISTPGAGVRIILTLPVNISA